MAHQSSKETISSFSTSPSASSASSPFSFSSDTSHASILTSDLIPMRVFLFQTAKGLFSSSGGYKANICLLRYLASRGHSVRQLCYSHPGEVEAYVRTAAECGWHDPQLRRRLLHLSAQDGLPGVDVKVEELVLNDGVEFVALESEVFDTAFGGKEGVLKEITRQTADYIETKTLSPRLLDFVSFMQQEITRFAPTHIISNDGLSMMATSALVMPNIDVCRVGVVHTAEQLPFGPFAGGMPGHGSSPSEINLYRQLDGIWSVSSAIENYALKHGQLQTRFFVHHAWTYLEEKEQRIPAHLHNWNRRFIGMINPCPVKGSSILIGLAKLCPQHDFLVYKSWGFNDEIGNQMKDLENITVRPTSKDMEEVWRDIKVLLVPSLWLEAWGIVVIEAHLRGIPVISSDAGALPEAMLGLDHIIPVNPIQGEYDEKGAYVVPDQCVRPWAKTVNERVSNRLEYERLSTKVRDVTQRWLKNADETALERCLVDLAADPSKNRVA
ncbi:hypothetical protein M3J09_009156 [Ascochyta lentis]